MKTKNEVAKEIAILAAHLQIVVEKIEGLEGVNSFFKQGVKNKGNLFKKEVDFYLNQILTATGAEGEGAQVEAFALVNILEKGFNKVLDTINKDIYKI